MELASLGLYRNKLVLACMELASFGLYGIGRFWPTWNWPVLAYMELATFTFGLYGIGQFWPTCHMELASIGLHGIVDKNPSDILKNVACKIHNKTGFTPQPFHGLTMWTTLSFFFF